MSLWKILTVAVFPVTVAAATGSAHALDIGTCGTVNEIVTKLVAENQSAFGKGQRLTTAGEMKELHITQPTLFGVLYFANADWSRGYIVRTNAPLAAGPTHMCVDFEIANINQADARSSGVSQDRFIKSSILGEYIKTLDSVGERVMFQADVVSGPKELVQPGTIVTATANMLSQDPRYQGSGSILFTAGSTGNTSKIYYIGEIGYTKGGLERLTPIRAGAAKIVANSGTLQTDGLSYASALIAIYAGDFGEVGFDKDSSVFAALVTSYREAFSTRCTVALPATKVEIMKDQCAREEWQENGYGEVPGSRHCVSTIHVGTGRYADPDVNKLSDLLQARQLGLAAGSLTEALRDPIGYASRALNTAIAAGKDMNELLAQNGCSSASTKRFQENLVRFGTGRDGIVTPGMRKPSGPEGNLYTEEIEPFSVSSGWFRDWNLTERLRKLGLGSQQKQLRCAYKTDRGYIVLYNIYKQVDPELLPYFRSDVWQGRRAVLAACPKRLDEALAAK